MGEDAFDTIIIHGPGHHKQSWKCRDHKSYHKKKRRKLTRRSRQRNRKK